MSWLGISTLGEISNSVLDGESRIIISKLEEKFSLSSQCISACVSILSGLVGEWETIPHSGHIVAYPS